ncbi:MAG: TonB-dependent receptor [Kofleriaceae bacterium]|nr:TonB-dependent receptor [Kofleriaceae bacterium]
MPIVDVADLPPLPPPEQPAVSHVAVVAASSVEEDVVVGAAKREQSLGNVASAVTVISGDRLRRFGYRTVAEALRAVAGVFIVDDHMSERVGIRGLQVLGDFNTRLLVLVDGATVNEPWNQFAGVGWDAPVSIDDVARIEVIRGPVSSVYGTNAFFGIINIVTRGADQAPRAWGRVTATSRAGAALAAGFARGGVDRQLRGSVAANLRGGEDLNARGIGSGLGADTDQARAVAASLVGAWDGAFAQLRVYRRERRLPFAPYEAVVGDPRNQNTDTQLLLEGGYTRPVTDRLTLTGRLYASRYQFTDFLVYEPADANFEDLGDSEWLGAEARARWTILDRDRLGLTSGVEATLVSTESHSFYQGQEGTRIPQDFDVQGIYAELDGAPRPWLAFTAGLRADRNSILDDRVSPRAALFLADGDRYGLKLLYAEGFRNPSMYEGFFADGVDFTANPAIHAETIRSYEAVLWARPISGVSARVSGFRWDAGQLVEQLVDDATGLLQFQNTESRSATGVEVEASWRDARGWLATGGATAVRVRGDDGVRVAGAPALTATLGVSTPRLRDRVHLSTEVQVIGPRTTRVDGVDAGTFVAWNAVAYAPDLGGFDLTIGVRNLIGRHEQVPAQEDYDRTDGAGAPVVIPVVPGEGRELYARLGYHF